LSLSVNEIFTSFQGEGLHTGLPTTFIRLAGCNLRCEWCDTEYALDLKDGTEMSIEEIVDMVKRSSIQLVCLTGGEPLMQTDAVSLVRSLMDADISIDIETNGSIDISDLIASLPSVMVSIDVKTPSSKEQGSFLMGNLDHLRPSDQMKFIIKDNTDLQFALAFISENEPACKIVITPVDNKGGEDLAKRILELVRKGKLPRDIRLMVQSHKVLWDPELRGV